MRRCKEAKKLFLESATLSSLVDDVGAATVAGIKGKLWATFVPAEAPAEGQRPRGASVVARDFQTVALYGSDGAFVGVRRPGSGKPIEVRYFLVEGTLKKAWRACMWACCGRGMHRQVPAEDLILCLHLQ